MGRVARAAEGGAGGTTGTSCSVHAGSPSHVRTSFFLLRCGPSIYSPSSHTPHHSTAANIQLRRKPSPPRFVQACAPKLPTASSRLYLPPFDSPSSATYPALALPILGASRLPQLPADFSVAGDAAVAFLNFLLTLRLCHLDPLLLMRQAKNQQSEAWETYRRWCTTWSLLADRLLVELSCLSDFSPAATTPCTALSTAAAC